MAPTTLAPRPRRLVLVAAIALLRHMGARAGMTLGIRRDPLHASALRLRAPR